MKITMTEFGVFRMIDEAIDRLKNLGPAMDDIAGELLAISDEAFINLADPTTGTPWPALAESTVIERALLGHGASEVLQRSGTLKRAIATQAGADFVEIGAAIEYALIHQFGGQAGRAHGVTIKARPYVGAHEDDLADFEKIIVNHVLR